MHTIPHFLLKVLKGGFGFCVGFFLMYLPAHYIPVNIESYWNQTLLQSDHLFVEVLHSNTSIQREPLLSSDTLKSVNNGTLLLLTDVKHQNQLTWNKVLIGENKFGWVIRVMPAQIGIPKKRITLTNKFYFRYKDIYSLALAFIGFLWGFFKFRVKPA